MGNGLCLPHAVAAANKDLGTTQTLWIQTIIQVRLDFCKFILKFFKNEILICQRPTFRMYWMNRNNEFFPKTHPPTILLSLTHSRQNIASFQYGMLSIWKENTPYQYRVVEGKWKRKYFFFLLIFCFDFKIIQNVFIIYIWYIFVLSFLIYLHFL